MFRLFCSRLSGGVSFIDWNDGSDLLLFSSEDIGDLVKEPEPELDVGVYGVN